MSLLGLGYGLGGFMKGLNEEQNQQLLQQLSRLDLQRVQQQIRAQQQYDATAPLLYNYYLNQQEGGQQGQPSAPQFGGGSFGGGTQAPTPPAAAQPSSPPQLGSGPTFGGIGDYGGGEPPGMGDYYAPARDQTDTGSGPNSITRQLTGIDPYAFLRDASPYSRFGSSQPLRLDAGGSFPAGPRGAARGANVTPSQPLSGLLPEFSPGGSGQYTYDSSGNLIDQVTGLPLSSASSRAATPTTDIPPAATAPSSPPGGGSGSSAAAGPPLSAGDDSDGGGRRLPLSLGTGADTGTYGGSKADYIRQQAAKYPNINPNDAIRTVMGEGGVGRFRLGDAGTSGGPFQLHVGGGLGDEFRKQTGLNPLDPRNEKAGIDWTLKYVSEQLGGKFPPNIWHGNIGGGRGGGGAGFGAGGGGGANDAILQQAMQLIQKGLAPVPESMFGNMTAHQMAVQIEKANPNADPVVKMLALERGMKMMAPEERLKTEMYMQQHQDEFRLGLAILQSQLTQGRQEASSADKGWTTMQMAGPDGKQIPVRVQPSTGKVEPLNLPGGGTGLTKVGTGSQTAPTPETVDFAATMISEYRMAPISGWALRSLYGQQVMQKVAQLNPDYDATKYQQKQRGAIAFTSGRQGDSVRSFSVAIDHLATMEDVASALANGDVQALNRLGNVIQKEFGYAGPVDFNFAKSIVGDEVSKAVIGGVGSLADRQQLQNGFDLANSPEQLGAVSHLAKRLMAGQLAGYRRQAGTAGFSDKDFENALSPQAKKELEGLGPQGPSGPPATGLPPDLPDSSGLPDGATAKDENGNVIAIIKSGQWANP